jgi:ankyrin repeat protein
MSNTIQRAAQLGLGSIPIGGVDGHRGGIDPHEDVHGANDRLHFTSMNPSSEKYAIDSYSINPLEDSKSNGVRNLHASNVGNGNGSPDHTIGSRGRRAPPDINRIQSKRIPSSDDPLSVLGDDSTGNRNVNAEEARKEREKASRKYQLEQELKKLELNIEKKKELIDRKRDSGNNHVDDMSADSPRKEVSSWSRSSHQDEHKKGHGSTSSSSVTDDERARFEKEKIALEEKLQMMEMQNKVLANRVERTEQQAKAILEEEASKRLKLEQAESEAKQLLELERAQKTLAISQLESEQREQLEAEIQAKQELEDERIKLKAKLAEIEKSELETQELLLLEQQRREKIEKAEMEAKELLKLEKQERSQLIAEMEKEKQNLILERDTIEKSVEKEREELLVAMKKMEQEKNELFDRITSTEDQAREEAIKAEIAKEQFEHSLKNLEEEKKLLAKKMEDNKVQSEMVNEAMAEKLCKERDELASQMKLLEAEKLGMAKELESSQIQSQKKAEEIEKQLLVEREELQESLQRMEDEKHSLAKHLKEKIEESHQQTAYLNDKVEAETTKLKMAIKQAEEEKNNIAERLQDTEKKWSESIEEKKSSEQKQTEEEIRVHKEMSEKLAREREELRQQLEAMAEEKKEMQKEMQKQLQHSENLVKEQHTKELERISREREELQKTVMRMKEEIKKEKELEKSMDAQAGSKGSESEELEPLKQLKPSKSLFNMFEDDDEEEPKLPRTLSKVLNDALPHTIDAIPEGGEMEEKEADEMFGIEDSDDWGEGSAQSKDIDIESKNRGGEGDKKGGRSDSKMGASPAKSTSSSNSPSKQSDPFDDLPAPHAAAAGGDVSRLRMLGRLETSLLSSFDAAHRCPLFYAVAYGQVEITQYLVEACPEMIDSIDAHGDTPLHAAASGGSAECMGILLKAKSQLAKKSVGSDISLHSDASIEHYDSGKYGNIADPRNAMDMTPSHLARTPEVLEVLYSFGANLASQDQNGRSPLFVACAMNRESCTEYIINSLDREGQTDEIYGKDRRGDTALHAAACNGSVDCLLLLLQYGIDPTVSNGKNLKAIDLAARNGQAKCRDLLAEYHLHYCTSSEFDSILFLATLEGHRQVKADDKTRKAAGISLESSSNKESNNDTDGDYQIIKKKPSFSAKANISPSMVMDNTSQMGSGLKNVKSMFSLKTKQSLRLQRWGDWIAYEDQQTSHIYYYNHSTSNGQWEKPEEVAKAQLEAAMNVQATSGTNESKGLTSKKSMRLRKHGEWIEYITETGRAFFYNEKNGEFQWTPPPGVVPQSAATYTEPGNVATTMSEKSPDKTDSANPFSTGSPESVNNEYTNNNNSVDVSIHSAPPPSDWQPYKDPDSGEIFWYNSVTQVSQWDCPLDNVNIVDSSPTKGGDDDQDDDDEIIAVHNDDDLGI